MRFNFKVILIYLKYKQNVIVKWLHAKKSKNYFVVFKYFDKNKVKNK